MIEQFTFRRLDLTSKIKPFDCGDPDLNEFFQLLPNFRASFAVALLFVLLLHFCSSVLLLY